MMACLSQTAVFDMCSAAFPVVPGHMTAQHEAGPRTLCIMLVIFCPARNSSPCSSDHAACVTLLRPLALSGPIDKTKWCIVYCRLLAVSLRDDPHSTSTCQASLIEDSRIAKKSPRQVS